MTVYLDIVFVENVCMNYIILLATGVLLKLKLHHIKLVLSAVLGAVYAIVSYIQIFPFASNMILKIGLSVCMVYIAYMPKGLKILLKQLVMFYLVSFVFGGCAFALLYFVKPEEIFMINGVYIGTYPVKIALLGAIVGFVFVHIAFKIVRNRLSKKGLLYDIEITLDDKKTCMKAMLDTGNQLKDPITKIPVIVVERDKLQEILPPMILNYTEQIMKGTWQETEENICYKERFRIIPFSSIGKQNGMLLGFKVDKVTVITDIDEIQNENVIVCIYNQRLSKTNAYSAIIGLDMLERREENELVTDIKI